MHFLKNNYTLYVSLLFACNIAIYKINIQLKKITAITATPNEKHMTCCAAPCLNNFCNFRD